MNKYYPAPASNVYFTRHHQGIWSRFEMVAWVNMELICNIAKVEHLCTGAAYCYLANFRLLQNAFDQVKVDTQIPMSRLVKGRFTDNLEFACWFRRFFEANHKKATCPDYDPLDARGSQFIGLGPFRQPTRSEVQAMQRHRRSVRISIRQWNVALQKEEHVGHHIGEGDQLHSKRRRLKKVNCS